MKPIDLPNVQRQLKELGKDGQWLTERLGIDPTKISGWFNGTIPPEEVKVVLELEMGAERPARVPLDLERFLELELEAAEKGISFNECLSQIIVKSLDETKASPKYKKDGKIVTPNFTAGHGDLE